MSDRILIGIYSHDGDFIDYLFDSDREFEGQIYAPQFTINANGQRDLSLSMPLRILSKDKSKYIDNPRWEYITKQYKVRIEDSNGINEYVLRSYDEIHSDSDQIIINATFMSLAEFELSQIGYDIVFDENTLRMYASNEDPNDPDNTPIGTYNSDIHFWEEKLLEKVPSWNHKVESYYEVDNEMAIDNRQITDPTSELKTGKEQFYEDDRIISYDDDNEPIKRDTYEIKQRILTASKSSVWNIQQDICEKFECWPIFEIKYNNEGKIISKTILLKNDLPQDALFTIDYKKNLKNIQRTVDASQVVTKMYVSDLDNENVNEGIVSISTNEKNYMKENYLLDLSWFLGENTTDSDLESQELIKPNLTLTFKASNYANPKITEKTITNTKDIIEQHKTNIRHRNIYIENKSLELSEAKDNLINLKEELEFMKASRDSAQETLNDIREEWALCPDGPQTKEKRKCYVYTEDGNRIVKFSEKGVRVSDVPRVFYDPINLVFTESGADVTKENVNLIQWEPLEYDEIVGTVTKMIVLNVKLGSAETYGCFSCDLTYYPLDFYNKLRRYWSTKVNEYKVRLEELGELKENGGTIGLIPELENKIEILKSELYNAQKEKSEAINEFENLMFPYIREGYWEDTDYGIYTNNPVETLKMIPKEEPLIDPVKDYVDWDEDYLCFKIPNTIICNYNTLIEELTYDQNGNVQIVNRTERKTLRLYDVIDINTVEVSTINPAYQNAIGGYRTYVKGTDFEVQYGYTTYDKENESEYDRGIYITFLRRAGSQFYTHDITKDTELYIRAKARSGQAYIFGTEIKPKFNNVRPYFAPMDRTLEIIEDDVVASSVKVEFSTGLVNYSSSIVREATQQRYELLYGKDYNIDKQLDPITKKTVTRIHLNSTTNSPLGTEGALTDVPSWYNLTYEQDVTGKFYYNDAIKIMKNSCIPQVSYTIGVLDISTVLNPNLKVENFKPVVGTKIPIYDEELNFNGLVGFVSSITYDLLEPQNTTLTVTNFKDKFEDLFQKITASTIALESKEYNFDKATQITTSSGEIKVELLMNSLMQNNMALALSPNNDVVWDNSGITVTNKDLNKDGVYGKLKITSNGIFISNKYDEFGNYAWTTAITPDFINANAITVGHLDTRQIQIFNSTEPRFMWNESGLYAYGENADGYTDFNSYVVYNHDGLNFRELATLTNSKNIDNLFSQDFKTQYTSWEYVGDNQQVKQETVNGKPRYYIRISHTYMENSIEAKIKSNTFKTTNELPRIVKGHKYYYSAKVRFNNIPSTAAVDLYAGFSGRYKELEFEEIKGKVTSNNKTSSGWNIISGFAENIDNTGSFGVIAALTELNQEWSLDIAEPIIIDITEGFGLNTPKQSDLDELSYFIGTQKIDKGSMNIYQTSVSLGWNGLSIGAQDNVVQLTSTDGLVIYAPTDGLNHNNREMRVQLGTWTDDDGTEKYGIRGLKNGMQVFELSQEGVKFSYNGDSSFGTMDDIVEDSIGYNCYITSSNGDTFINGNVNTILTITVVKGKEDITDTLNESNFEWKKIGYNGLVDTTWTPEYVNNTRHTQVKINAEDIAQKATFVCTVKVSE